MAALSLFDAMEFSMPENCLEESFGLSAEILAADIGSEGSILDSDLGHLDCLKYEPEQPTSQSFDDLLFEVADSLGHDWMENVDLKLLLNGGGQSHLESTTLPEMIHSPEQPTTSKLSIDSEPEPLKEGMKAYAYEKLKALLTDDGPTDKVQSTILTPPQSPHSPEAIVPNLSVVAPSFDSLLEEPSENVLEGLIQLQSSVQSASGTENGNIDVQNTIDLVELLSPVTDVSQSINSPEDDDSCLASIPPSPSDSFTLETVDIAKLKELDSYTSSDTGSQTLDQEFTKLKSKSKKDIVRSAPYEVEMPCVGDKKDRKKVQNKNAATRYRVKKRQEKESLQKQESDLADKNKELREKVESLQREISYMKELMNEIYKAKKSKI
jgi:hypothetical protein